MPNPIEGIAVNDSEFDDVLEIAPDAENLIVDIPLPESIEQQTNKSLQRVTVKTGDSLALIFSRLGLSPRSLYNIMSLGKEVSRLKKLRPGQILNFHINANELDKLEYEVNLTDSLLITKQDGQFQAELVHEKLENTRKLS